MDHPTDAGACAAGPVSAPQGRAPLRLLLSYWHFRYTDLDAVLARNYLGIPLDIFADSGAFSAMTQGVKIELAQYAAWLHRYKHHFTTYANLDVIRHAEKTWRNQQELEQTYGLAPLPVFHVAESFDWLERYLARYSYIALGVAGQPPARYMGWAVRCFQLAHQRPVPAAYHGFGITGWTALRSLPWYSADSSTWMAGVRFGEVPVWIPRRLRMIRAHLGNPASVGPLARQIRAYGYDPLDFLLRERNSRTYSAGLAALSYRAMERTLLAYGGPITRPDDPSCLGPRVYLAQVPNEEYLAASTDAYRREPDDDGHGRRRVA